MRRRTVLRGSLREFTQTCVDHFRLLQQQNISNMLFLLINFLVNSGSSSCRRRIETFSKFCEFKALVDKVSGKQVKDLRSDNGGEYISNEFKDFCSREGIQRELIAPHNPQQNGVAERKNRTIVGAARAMFHDQGLPIHLRE